MKFSEKIIKLRKEKGLSQEEFGNKINVSRQAVSKWESEQAQPEVEKVKEISKVFDISIEYLLDDKVDNPKEKAHKKSRKNIGKIILISLVVLISIYLLYCIYKFVLLFIQFNNIFNVVVEVSFSERSIFFSS